MKKLMTTTIEFGLVTIPVSIWKYGKEHDISMSLISECHSASVKHSRVCSECGKAVVNPGKGVWFGDKLVKFTDEEIGMLKLEDTNIVFEEIVKKDAIDWTNVKNVYAVGDDEKMNSAKHLGSFVEALKRLDAVAVGQWVWKGTCKLVALVPKDDGAVLVELRYSDEKGSVVKIEEKDERLVEKMVKLMQMDLKEKMGEYKDKRYERFKEILMKKMGLPESKPVPDMFEMLGLKKSGENGGS